MSGYYKIKYTKYFHSLSNKHSEISYFKNGFRYGYSRLLRFNKLEEEGTYVNGLKHGIWKSYFFFNGELRLTSEYKMGKKNGVEFGKNFNGKFICNYINDTIDGSLLTYDNFSGYLKSKEYYNRGEKLYKHTYDDFLNIKEEHHYSNIKDTIIIEENIKKIGKGNRIDSTFYNKKEITVFNEKIPFKLKQYTKGKKIFERETLIKKDTTRIGENNYILIINDYFDAERKTIMHIYYNSLLLNLHTLQSIRKSVIETRADICLLYNTLIFEGFEKFSVYYQNEESNYFYELNYDKKRDLINSDCYIGHAYKIDSFQQSY